MTFIGLEHKNTLTHKDYINESGELHCGGRGREDFCVSLSHIGHSPSGTIDARLTQHRIFEYEKGSGSEVSRLKKITAGYFRLDDDLASFLRLKISLDGSQQTWDPSGIAMIGNNK